MDVKCSVENVSVCAYEVKAGWTVSQVDCEMQWSIGGCEM